MNDSVRAAIDSFAAGEMVVVSDDPDRENEADLIVAAELATVEQVGFMIRYTSGIICAAMDGGLASKLEIDPMVENNQDVMATAFGITVDASSGITTGVSASDRLKTLQSLAKPSAIPSDLVRPGHVFPLIAKDGGVLTRLGHTESAVDLCRLAGVAEVGVLSELTNEDGTMTSGSQVVEFASVHGLVHITTQEIKEFLLNS